MDNAVSGVVQALLADIVAPALPILALALGAWALRLAQRYLGLRLTTDQTARLNAAALLGAKAAYGWLAREGLSYADTLSRNAALQRGAQVAVGQIQPLLAVAGVTDDQVRQLVEHELGGLLAVDPSVSVIPAAVPSLAAASTATADASAPATDAEPAAALSVSVVGTAPTAG